MRAVVVGWCLMAASSLKVCSSEESGGQGSDKAAVSASASASLSAVAPRIGGQMLVVGDHAVELLVHKSGLIEAVVADASNQAVTTSVGFAVSAPAKGGKSEAIGLTFVPARARFEGNAKAGVELTSGPLEVALTAQGKTAKATLASGLALGKPRFGGNLLIADGQAFELLLKPTGEVLAFPSATLSAPKFELEANLPVVGGARERVTLRFDAPRKCFSGRARAGVELTAGPIDLGVVGKAGVALGRLQQVPLRAEAAHGGAVLVAGDYSIELTERADMVEAYAFDAQGKALTTADLGVSLEFGGRPETNVALAWEPEFGCYRAKLRDGIELDTTPIQLTVATGGRAFVGAAASLRAIGEVRLDPPRLRAAPQLAADARVEANLPSRPEFRADVRVPDVRAEVGAEARRALGAAAAVKIAPPKVSIQKSASAGAKAGGAKASAGFSFGVK